MKKAVLSLAVILLFAAGAFAKTQALIRKDGRRHVGLISKAQDKDGYNVKMRIGVIFVPSNEVARIEDATTPLEEFRGRLAKIKPADVKARYKLAQWAFRKRLLSESGDVLKAILKVEPNHKRAKLLLEEIEARKVRTEDPAKLREEYFKRRAAIGANDAKGNLMLGQWAYEKKLLRDAKVVLETALRIDPKLAEAAKLLAKINAAITAGGASTAGVQDKFLLSMTDVYKVRLEEFRQKGDLVGVKYRKRVLQRFIAAMSGRDDFEGDMHFGKKFMGYTSIKKLQYILDPNRDIAPETLDTLKKDIIIESDPIFMRTFRSRIWPIVRQNCATTACHGAPEGKGKVKLFSSPARDGRITYTNFVILAGSSGKKGGRVLDRDTPAESLLLEYLLPKSQAKRPHPVTKKAIRNLFKNREQPAYKLLRDWISALSAPGYPDYHLEYKPPFGMKLDLSGGGGTLPPRGKTRKDSGEGRAREKL
ncbi:MAG: hypothetical protein QGH60_19065 [Phycisphaerae bacterium]|jgi:tetratricopeptide (TPR) repeat protein|nr:hypothetical protein [Phycisphaerae bacterium]